MLRGSAETIWGTFRYPGMRWNSRASIRGTLNVRLSPKGVDASACNADIAKQQLNDRACAMI